MLQFNEYTLFSHDIFLLMLLNDIFLLEDLHGIHLLVLHTPHKQYLSVCPFSDNRDRFVAVNPFLHTFGLNKNKMIIVLRRKGIK